MTISEVLVRKVWGDAYADGFLAAATLPLGYAHEKGLTVRIPDGKLEICLVSNSRGATRFVVYVYPKTGCIAALERPMMLQSEFFEPGDGLPYLWDVLAVISTKLKRRATKAGHILRTCMYVKRR